MLREISFTELIKDIKEPIIIIRGGEVVTVEDLFYGTRVLIDENNPAAEKIPLYDIAADPHAVRLYDSAVNPTDTHAVHFNTDITEAIKKAIRELWTKDNGMSLYGNDIPEKDEKITRGSGCEEAAGSAGNTEDNDKKARRSKYDIEAAVLKSWNRGNRTIMEVVKDTGINYKTVRKYLPASPEG